MILELAALLGAQDVAGVSPAQGAPPAATTTAADVPAPTPYEAMLAAARQVRDVHYEDSPDQQRRMAASDRSPERFFNRPGAEAASYQEEWQLCRRVARWLASDPLRLPSGPNIYIPVTGLVPAVIGSVLVGGMQAGFSERTARRDIRRQCLLARGWRMVEPDEAGRGRLRAMGREERNAYFDRMLGAAEIASEGRVSEWGSTPAIGAAGEDGD